MKPGDLVQYFADGWRTGYLKSIDENGLASVQPIAAYKGVTPHKIAIPVKELKTTQMEHSRG